MKDAASRIATIAWESHDNMIDTQWQNGVRRMIRSAIRRAVKAERERCVKCADDLKQSDRNAGGWLRNVSLTCDDIIKAIQAKRPSRRK